jgi:outer membrane beta-barrel protein
MTARAEDAAGSYHHALELQSGWAWSEGSPLMDRSGPTFAVAFYPRRFVAIGFRGTVYTDNADTDFDFQLNRATHTPLPIDAYQWPGELTVLYAPLHGHLAFLGFDAYLLAGAGLISTQPVPVIDPDHRAFGSKVSGSFGGGGGLRLFFGRWFAATFEVRDFAFFGHHEAITVAATAADRANPATWYAATALTDNVQLIVGLSLFAPVPLP